ncbi:hypothetical protein [Psychromicrobium lacuslunae]|uniref:hypothetical protein n=1 Tax=Psychromicrobium lacuslunae TaxID=1618207 RepID=UPI0012FF5948|nr:hypothetical protein [Psychromicrobium lacuslunae]
MPLGMKLELTFDANVLSLGELRAFLARADAAGALDTQEVRVDFDENEEVSGLSMLIS